MHDDLPTPPPAPPHNLPPPPPPPPSLTIPPTATPIARPAASNAPPYEPWREQQITGIALLIGGCIIIMLGVGHHFWMFLIGIAMACFGGYQLKLAQNRIHGKKTERKAISRIRMPKGWTVEENKLINGIGDIDVYLVSPTQERFCVEIKSWKGIRVKQAGFFGYKEELLHITGNKLNPDPIPQVLRNAEHLRATPVLWLPDAAHHRIDKLKKTGIIVVQGNARRLRRALSPGWF